MSELVGTPEDRFSRVAAHFKFSNIIKHFTEKKKKTYLIIFAILTLLHHRQPYSLDGSLKLDQVIKYFHALFR